MNFPAKSEGELLTNPPFASVFAQGIVKKKARKTILLIGEAIALIFCMVFLIKRVILLISGAIQKVKEAAQKVNSVPEKGFLVAGKGFSVARKVSGVTWKGFSFAWKVSGVVKKGFSVVWKAFLVTKKTGFGGLKVGEIRLPQPASAFINCEVQTCSSVGTTSDFQFSPTPLSVQKLDL